jgi:hypothetical protein
MSSNAQLALTGRNEREYLTQSHAHQVEHVSNKESLVRVQRAGASPSKQCDALAWLRILLRVILLALCPAFAIPTRAQFGLLTAD